MKLIKLRILGIIKSKKFIKYSYIKENYPYWRLKSAFTMWWYDISELINEDIDEWVKRNAEIIRKSWFTIEEITEWCKKFVNLYSLK